MKPRRWFLTQGMIEARKNAEHATCTSELKIRNALIDQIHRESGWHDAWVVVDIGVIEDRPLETPNAEDQP